MASWLRVILKGVINMNNNVTIVISFLVGAAVGVASTYKIAEKKYRDIADSEIESVKEQFKDRKPLVVNETEQDNHQVLDKKVAVVSNGVSLKPDIASFRSTIAKNDYNTVSNQTSVPTKHGYVEEEDDMPEEALPSDIYTIDPEEFNVLEDYGCATYYYTADDQIVDDTYEPLDDEDIRLLFGGDVGGRFGEYEEDSVHIRNELKKMDYEILQSQKTLDEIREV